jgi:DNA polymerase-3 subunit delta'
MLAASREQKRLSHALLFTGVQGLGKRQLALRLAKAILCNKSQQEPCEECHSCHLIAAESHPDFKLIEPEQAGSFIKIDQIRELTQFASETAMQGNNRVLVVNPANAMNIYAANALLKTLEEPAPNTILILISDQSSRLPATIRSRCQKVVFQKPSTAQAITWLNTQIVNDGQAQAFLPILLNIMQGAPLKVKESLENGFFALREEFYKGLTSLSQDRSDPLQLATHFQDKDVRLLLQLLLLWLQDLLRCTLTQGAADLVNTDYRPTFEGLSQLSINKKIFDYLDHVKKMYSYMLSSLNLNRQLMWEELFIRWASTCR